MVEMPTKRTSELCGDLGQVDRNGYYSLDMSMLSELCMAEDQDASIL